MKESSNWAGCGLRGLASALVLSLCGGCFLFRSDPDIPDDLTSDSEISFSQAARSVAFSGNHKAIPALLSRMDDPNIVIRQTAWENLLRLIPVFDERMNLDELNPGLRRLFGYAWADESEEGARSRHSAVKRWQAWWKRDGEEWWNSHGRKLFELRKQEARAARENAQSRRREANRSPESTRPDPPESAPPQN